MIGDIMFIYGDMLIDGDIMFINGGMFINGDIVFVDGDFSGSGDHWLCVHSRTDNVCSAHLLLVQKQKVG